MRRRRFLALSTLLLAGTGAARRGRLFAAPRSPQEARIADIIDIDLGPAEFSTFMPADINDQRLVVGSANDQNGSPITAVDLNSLLPADSGWRLHDLAAANNAGQLVGMGYVGGAYRAFLATLG